MRGGRKNNDYNHSTVWEIKENSTVEKIVTIPGFILPQRNKNSELFQDLIGFFKDSSLHNNLHTYFPKTT